LTLDELSDRLEVANENRIAIAETFVVCRRRAAR
jgi:hypothetical protein